jgi:hypothetical protein
MKILMHYTFGWQKLADCVYPNLVEYCKRHRYQLALLCVNDYGRYTGEHKIKQIMNEVDYGEVALVLDADTYITNHLIEVESFVDNDHDLYLTKDINGINSGVFIVKMTAWMQNFLNYIYNSIQSGNFDCEQNAIEQYINVFGLERIKIVEHPAFNSYPINFYAPSYGKIGYQEGDYVEKPTRKQGAWQLGDFILHAPGLTIEKRIEIFTNTPIVK